MARYAGLRARLAKAQAKAKPRYVPRILVKLYDVPDDAIEGVARGRGGAVVQRMPFEPVAALLARVGPGWWMAVYPAANVGKRQRKVRNKSNTKPASPAW